ncbi:MAG: translation initiation factor IF-2 subunit beta [Candidatus Altiarchaeales archaeon ex4484_2]|nr:MAG: translation initiation factor IF-2 subunit beta [Candidatus Altiarchaeales archaeon ex4484_2]
MEYKYEELLDRVWTNLPDELKSTSRFEMPEIKTNIQGKQTYIMNFNEIADAFQREPQHVLLYIIKELAAPATYDGKKAIIQRRLRQSMLQEKIKKYAEEYVFCHECHRPDTKVAELKGEKIIKCTACGGWWPLKKIK